MGHSEPPREALLRAGSLAASPSSASGTGISIYGAGHDETRLFREMAARLGVTIAINSAALTETTMQFAGTNRCISVDHKTQIDCSMLRVLREAGVRYISTRSAGTNHIDVKFARSVGITVKGVAYSPDSVADYTLMLMLMAVRNARSIITRSEHHDFRLNEMRGRELRDMTVGVIGTGRIGSAVIDRLRGFGCLVLAYDRCPDNPAEYVELDELLQRSDLVTLHTPLSSATHHLLDGRRIDHMKQGAIVVNTGRGALIDTEALVLALESGSLGGAALDVLEDEEDIFYLDRRPRPIAEGIFLRLQRLSNVLITPHTAYYTDHALADVIENTLINCLDFERRKRG